jgi:hypothetical protein
VHRAIAGGRLSAARTESGGWSIDPAELARVFPADSSGNGLVERIGTEPPAEELAQVRADRDRFRALAEERDETIRDLRTRLDHEAEERRKLTAILTGPQRSWWRRWFR